MPVLQKSPVAFFRQLATRFREWKLRRQNRVAIPVPHYLIAPPYAAPIHREVTSSGVRVFSLCGECGCRLQASATLCDECAQKRKPARPY